MRRLAASIVVSTLAFAPLDAAAGDGKPLPRGSLVGGLSLGGVLGPRRDIQFLNFGGSITYFPWSSRWNSIGFGLEVTDTVFIYSDSIKNDFPGIEDNTPTNVLRVTPHLIFTIVRTRWFTPYVWAGVGPTIYNNRQGVVGQWVAGPGAMIGVGGPVFINVGVRFSSTFPSEDCKDAYRLTPGGPTIFSPPPCGFTWWPQLGLSLSFGVGAGDGERKSERRRRREERRRQKEAEQEPPTWEEPPRLEAPPPAGPEPGPEPASTPQSGEGDAVPPTGAPPPNEPEDRPAAPEADPVDDATDAGPEPRPIDDPSTQESALPPPDGPDDPE